MGKDKSLHLSDDVIRVVAEWIGTDLDGSCLDADLEALTKALPGLLKVMYDCNNQDREDIETAVSAITWTIANLRDIHREAFK